MTIRKIIESNHKKLLKFIDNNIDNEVIDLKKFKKRDITRIVVDDRYGIGINIFIKNSKIKHEVIISYREFETNSNIFKLLEITLAGYITIYYNKSKNLSIFIGNFDKKTYNITLLDENVIFSELKIWNNFNKYCLKDALDFILNYLNINENEKNIIDKVIK